MVKSPHEHEAATLILLKDVRDFVRCTAVSRAWAAANMHAQPTALRFGHFGDKWLAHAQGGPEL